MKYIYVKFALKMVSLFGKVIVGYKNENSKNVSRTFSGVVVDSLGSIHFQLVPSSSLYF